MRMELELLYRLQECRNGLLDWVMVGVSRLGDAGFVWLFLAAVLVRIPRWRRAGAAMLLSLIMMFLICNVMLKPLVARERPCWADQGVELLVPEPRDYSFPSGHTYAAFTAAAALYYYHRKAGLAAFVFASVIAFSRLYLFVHYPSDVLGGLLLGLATAFLACRLLNWAACLGRGAD